MAALFRQAEVQDSKRLSHSSYFLLPLLIEFFRFSPLSVDATSVKKSLDDFVSSLVGELLEPEKNGLLPRVE